MTGTPAGWQPAPDRPDQLRYWDGEQWTDHYAPAGGPPASPQPPAKKSHTLRNVLLILGLLGVLVVGGCFAIVAATGDAINDAVDDASKAASTGHDVTYRVTGTAKTADVTFTTDGSTSTSQENGVAVPWSKDLKIDGELFSVYQVLAQNGGETGKVTCEILVDGESVKTNTSAGAYAIATCDYTP